MALKARHLSCKDESSWIGAANSWIESHLKEFNGRSLFVPAGETPKPLYKSWESTHPSFLKDVKMIQIDDVATGKKKDLFRQFFREYLPSYQRQLVFFEAGEQVADLAILGLGMNGHVAFHEPGMPVNFFSGCLELNAKTLEVLELEPGTWGQTFGLGAFLKSKAILMLVKGSKKASVVEKMLARDPSIPASHLLDHPRFTLVTDF